ncbi:MAG: CPBP family intramembrane glutamic endopeptidase [Chloroflexota bacterium]
MNIILPSLVVILATFGIFQLRKWTGGLKFTLLKDSQLDGLLKFQLAQLVLAALVLALAYLLNPANFAAFFRLGDVNAHIGKIAWLGVTGNETWLEIALTLGLFITLGTGIFMFLQAKKTGARFHLVPALLVWSLVFSAMNAFSEEAIFRMGIVSPLYGELSLPTIAIISGILFGLPHYFGQPSGPVGVLMAGFLGWLLALSLLETQGLFLAWAVHFVQDVVIFVSMFLISAKTNPGAASQA